MKTNITFPVRYFGRAIVITTSYRNGGGLAIELEAESGEPLCSLSVNLPDRLHLLGEQEFFAKTWSENTEIAKDALASGVFCDTGRTSSDGFNAPIWRLE